MKLPAAYKFVALNNDTYEVPYPPLGFYPIAEHQQGNGDMFGLYWPIGYEEREPIVAETWHDELSVQPHFSSLDRFLVAVGRFDGKYSDDTVPETPTFHDDPQSPAASLFAAREHLKSQNVEAAIACLETAVVVLPEYGDAQALLCAQYRRVGKNDAAIKAAVQAIIAPPCFGARPVKIAQWLSSQSSCPPELESDPIWINRERLNLKFFGVEENDEYKILHAAIEQYLDAAAFVPAMTLMLTYAQLMWRETVSFQERYEFDCDEFVSWQRDVAQSQYGKSRILELPDQRG